ncbi:MAG: hypothetical protein RL682_899 [Pseudomonadota bacterium]
MSTFERWEEVRAACELLHDIASHQADNDLHPLAKTASRWLDHVGAVAAREGCAGAPSATLMPTPGVMQ